jgi:hypothetical protein
VMIASASCGIIGTVPITLTEVHCLDQFEK